MEEAGVLRAMWPLQPGGCARHIAHIILFNPHNSGVKDLLFPFCRKGHKLEVIGLFKVLQLVSGRAEIANQMPCPLLLHLMNA